MADSLNNKNIEVLSAALKIDKETLINSLINVEGKELALPDFVIRTKEEEETYIKNLANQEYHKGKTAESEMSLKELKRLGSEKYGINTEGIKSHAELIDLIEKKKAEEFKAAFEGEGDKKIKEILSKLDEKNKEADLLRTKLLEIEETYKTQLSQKDNEFKKSIKDNELLKIANTIPFALPKNLISVEEKTKYIQTETSKFMTLFNSIYETDIENGQIVVKQNGTVIKDKLLQPEKIDKIAIDFAKQMNFNLSDNGGIQRPDGTKITNNFTGASKEQFDAVMKEKGIITGSNQYLTYYSEWKKSNS
jgi:hypothetical protein